MIEAFWAVHEAGVHHKDAAERNMVYTRDSGYLIDFEHASDNHKCTVECPEPDSIAQDPSDFPCEELWRMLTELGLWRPGISCSLSSSVMVLRHQLPIYSHHFLCRRISIRRPLTYTGRNRKTRPCLLDQKTSNTGSRQSRAGVYQTLVTWHL